MREIICALGRVLFLFKNKRKPKDFKKILVFRSGMIGDVLMTTPLLKSIRKKFPKADITYLVGDWSKKAIQGNPNIDSIITFDDRIIFKKKITKLIRLIRQIRKQRFDLCLVLDKHYLIGILAWLFKIPTRIGFNRSGEGFANNFNIPFTGKKHEIEYNMDIAKFLGADSNDKQMEINLTKKDTEFANKFLKKYKNKKKLIGISPGAAQNPGQNMPLKRWPTENYAELADILSKKATIILVGGPGDIKIAEKMNSFMKAKPINAVGIIALKESAALIKKCRLFITHDSGPMHLSAAVGTPTIALFGPTQPKRFGPIGKKHRIIIKRAKNCPCYDMYGNYKKCRKSRCMENLSVKKVADVINKII